MKKKFIIYLTLLIVLVLGTIILIKPEFNGDEIDDFKYDILVLEHRYEYEDVDPHLIPETGYSSSYYYTVINSEKLEKYIIIYTDVWNAHNERGEKDTVSIKKELIDKTELENAIKQYGKTKNMNSLKKLLDKNINEEYIIYTID